MSGRAGSPRREWEVWEPDGTQAEPPRTVGRGWADWMSSAEPGGWAAEQGEDVLRWACSMAFSRNFDSVFYPVADMANHAFKADQQENSLAMTNIQ